MKFQFHPLAEQEFEISADWYKERSIKHEKLFINQVLITIDFITKNPKIFQKIKGKKRAARVKGFPFSVIYIVDSSTIFIVSVFHHFRNPHVWRNR